MPFLFFSSFFEFLNDNPVSSTLSHWLLWSHKHKNFCFISHKLRNNGPCLCKKGTISGVVLWHFLNPWISESSPSSCCFFYSIKQNIIKCNWVQNIESSTKTILNNISKSMFIFLNSSSLYCWLLLLRGRVLYARLNHFQITWFLWFLLSQPSPVPTNTHPIFHPYFYYFSPQTRDFRIFHSTEKIAILLHFALLR